VHLKGVYLMGVYLMGVYLHWRVPHGRASHGRAPHLRVFLARRTRVAGILVSTEEVTCRVLVIKPYGNDDDVSLAEKSARVCLEDCPNTAFETRLIWA
jgi:hypothetical protein